MVFHVSQQSYLKWVYFIAMPFIHFLFLNYRLINTLSKYIYVHKLHLETGYSFSYLLDSYRGT